VDWERLNNNISNGTDSNSAGQGGGRGGHGINMHEKIMERMEESSVSAFGLSATNVNEDESQNKCTQAVESWINHVKIIAQQKNRQESSYQNQTSKEKVTTNGLQKEKKPIPYSLFLYLWELQQKPNRVAVRRSALLLSGVLLQKSKDCRFHLDQDTCLADWVSNIIAQDMMVWKNKDRAFRELPLLHREAISLLDNLIHKGYGSMYAKLGVASKNLKSRCSFEGSFDGSDCMIKWRKLRDVALLYGEKEIQKVEKILNRADTCLEILVPRIGIVGQLPPSLQHISSENQNTINGNQQKGNSDDHNYIIDDDDNDSDDKSGIDWEDGDEMEESDISSVKEQQCSHLSAVERTIAVMEASGTHENLEIDFDRAVNDKSEDDTDKIKLYDNVRKKLERIIQKLSNRHLIRLSAWLDGLRNSDSLDLMNSSISLVSMSYEKNELRLKLIERISALKEDVSGVLSSAKRLNIQIYKNKEKAHCGVATQNSSIRGLLHHKGTGDICERVSFETSRKNKQKSRRYRTRMIKINLRK